MPGRGDGMLGDVSNEVMAETIQTNVWGLFWCCKIAIPEMVRAGGGAIVNVSSGVATKGAMMMAAYTASKGAMNALTRSMAVEYAPQRIRVNAISTGFIDNGTGTEDLLNDPVRRQWLQSIIPLPYFGVPDDIAWGCVYLASDEASYVTGAEIVVDGGATGAPIGAPVYRVAASQ